MSTTPWQAEDAKMKLPRFRCAFHEEFEVPANLTRCARAGCVYSDTHARARIRTPHIRTVCFGAFTHSVHWRGRSALASEPHRASEEKPRPAPELTRVLWCAQLCGGARRQEHQGREGGHRARRCPPARLHAWPLRRRAPQLCCLCLCLCGLTAAHLRRAVEVEVGQPRRGMVTVYGHSYECVVMARQQLEFQQQQLASPPHPPSAAPACPCSPAAPPPPPAQLPRLRRAAILARECGTSSDRIRSACLRGRRWNRTRSAR